MLKKIFLIIFIVFFQQRLFANTSDFMSIDLQNVSLQDALHMIANRGDLNLVVSPGVTGDVTLHLHAMSAEKILNFILQAHGLVKDCKDKICMIMPRAEWMSQQQETDKLAEFMPLVTRVWQMHYANASDIAHLIQDKNSASLLSKRGSVHVDVRTNRVCIQDTAEKITAMNELIKRLDIPVQQVLISAHLASVDSDVERELGVDFTTNLANVPAHYSLAVAKLADGSVLDVQLAALEKNGRGELISSPSLFTANQRTASIESGEEIPYQEMSGNGVTAVVFKKAVLSLRVTPQILPGQQVLLQLQVNQDKPSDRIILGVPAITTRQISTQVLVTNGQTIVLGGIYETDKENSHQRVPFLSKIPVVGQLFQQKNTLESKRELLIFVTPKIVS